MVSFWKLYLYGLSFLLRCIIYLQQDRELEQFAQTPLMLNIMSVAYQDWSIKDLLREFLSSEDRYRHLFDSYIERMLRRRIIGRSEQKNNLPQYPQPTSLTASQAKITTKVVGRVGKFPKPLIIDFQ